MATPDWAAAGEHLLQTALQRAKAGDLQSLPVFEPEQAGSQTPMRPTGRSILLVAEAIVLVVIVVIVLTGTGHVGLWIRRHPTSTAE